MVNIKPSDIQKEYIIKATLNEGLPKDPVALGNAASQWKQAGVPNSKIFDEVFGFQDVKGLTEEALREQMDQLPPVMLTKAIKAFIDVEDFESAKILAALLPSTGRITHKLALAQMLRTHQSQPLVLKLSHLNLQGQEKEKVASPNRKQVDHQQG